MLIHLYVEKTLVRRVQQWLAPRTTKLPVAMLDLDTRGKSLDHRGGDRARFIVMRLLVTTVTIALLGTPAAYGQTRSIRETTTAYGARLNSRRLPAATNQRRIVNRIENRLSLRIERYRPNSSTDPTAAFTLSQNDRSRIAPTVAPPSPVQQDDID